MRSEPYDRIQSRPLAEKNLTYEKAYDLAISIEAADKQSRHIKETNFQGVHYSATGPKNDGTTLAKLSSTKKGTPIVYYRCGGEHLANVCQFKGKKWSRIHTLFTLNDQSSDPIIIPMYLNNVPVNMELDTGASVSILSKATYQFIAQQKQSEPLQESNVRIKTYTGEPIKILGSTSVTVKYGEQVVDLNVQVVDGDGPNLMVGIGFRRSKCHYKVTSTSTTLGNTLNH